MAGTSHLPNIPVLNMAAAFYYNVDLPITEEGFLIKLGPVETEENRRLMPNYFSTFQGYNNNSNGDISQANLQQIFHGIHDCIISVDGVSMENILFDDVVKFMLEKKEEKQSQKVYELSLTMLSFNDMKKAVEPKTCNPVLAKDNNVIVMSLQQVLDSMEGHQFSLLTKLAEKTVVADQQSVPSGLHHRFNVHFVRDLSKLLHPEDPFVSLSLDLIREWFEPKDVNKLEQILKVASDTSNIFVMLSLYGEACVSWKKVHPKNEHFSCLGTLIAIHSDKGCYISHIAVTNKRYSPTYYGSGDKKSFGRRGIAGLLICFLQYYQKKLHKGNPNMYTWSFNSRTNGSCCWKNIGFEEGNILSSLDWPVEISYFIEHLTLYSDRHLFRLGTLVPKLIKKDVSSPIAHDLVPVHEHTETTYPNVNRGRFKIPMTTFDGLLKDKIHYFSHLLKAKINDKVSMASINFFFLQMMMSDDSIYISDTQLAMTIMKHGFGQKLQQQSPEIKLIAEKAQNENSVICFPFVTEDEWNEEKWSFICRRWLNGELVFFYYSSKDKTSNSKLIPMEIPKLFINTPLWPLQKVGNFFNISGKEEGSTDHSMMLANAFLVAKSSAPHLCLKLFNKLDSFYKGRLNYWSRGWITYLWNNDTWFVPEWINKVLSLAKVTEYNTEFLKKNAWRQRFSTPPGSNWDVWMEQERDVVAAGILQTLNSRPHCFDYKVSARKCREGFMFNLKGMIEDKYGYTTCFHSYSPHADKRTSNLEKRQPFKNRGDIVISVDGIDLKGVSISNIYTMFQEFKRNRKKKHVSLLMMDILAANAHQKRCIGHAPFSETANCDILKSSKCNLDNVSVESVDLSSHGNKDSLEESSNEDNDYIKMDNQNNVQDKKISAKGQERFECNSVYLKDFIASDKCLDDLEVSDLIKDDDDRIYLDSLTELERETILAKRFQEVKDAKDYFMAINMFKEKPPSAPKNAEGAGLRRNIFSASDVAFINNYFQLPMEERNAIVYGKSTDVQCGSDIKNVNDSGAQHGEGEVKVGLVDLQHAPRENTSNVGVSHDRITVDQQQAIVESFCDWVFPLSEDEKDNEICEGVSIPINTVTQDIYSSLTHSVGVCNRTIHGTEYSRNASLTDCTYSSDMKDMEHCKDFNSCISYSAEVIDTGKASNTINSVSQTPYEVEGAGWNANYNYISINGSAVANNTSGKDSEHNKAFEPSSLGDEEVIYSGKTANIDNPVSEKPTAVKCSGFDNDESFINFDNSAVASNTSDNTDYVMNHSLSPSQIEVSDVNNFEPPSEAKNFQCVSESDSVKHTNIVELPHDINTFNTDNCNNIANDPLILNASENHLFESDTVIKSTIVEQPHVTNICNNKSGSSPLVHDAPDAEVLESETASAGTLVREPNVTKNQHKRSDSYIKCGSQLLRLFNEQIKIQLKPVEDELSISSESSGEKFKCPICTWGIDVIYHCDKCNIPIHSKCGFKVDIGNTILKLCDKCGKNEKRAKFETVKDASLSSEWFTSVSKEQRSKSIDAETRRKNKEQKLLQWCDNYNNWLATVNQIQYKQKGKKREFFGRNKDSKSLPRKIQESFLKDILCEFFTTDWEEINKEKPKVWITLPENLNEYIKSHGRCYSDPELFDNFWKCNEKEWNYVKFTAECEHPTNMCDTAENFDSTDSFYVSFTGNVKTGAEIQYVPLYYLRIWFYICESGEQTNELLNIVNHAWNKLNKWIRIPQGASRRLANFSHKQSRKHGPISHTIQPITENSCVFRSLINAFHYINDYRVRDELKNHVAVSLDYTKMSKVAHSRSAFAAEIVNRKGAGYTIIKMTNFDILQNRSLWPTLCVLESSSGSTCHAITVVENYIFDSNLSRALELSKVNLDWCCSTDYGPSEFIKVHHAYRFAMLKPKPELLIRTDQLRKHGVTSIMQAMEYLEQYATNSAINSLQVTGNPNECVISLVRDLLKSKEHGYRPKAVKTLDSLYNNTVKPWPSMILLHLPSTFSFVIVTVVENLLFDGKSGVPSVLSYENLLCTFPSIVDRTENFNCLQLMKGYTFVKDEKKRKLGQVEVGNKRFVLSMQNAKR